MKHAKEIWERPGFLIRRLHQIQTTLFLEECEKECPGMDITPVQWGVMSAVSGSPGTSHIELSEKLGLDRSNIANVVQRLAKKNILKVKISQQDRRRKEIRITSTGQQLMGRILIAAKRSQNTILNQLSEKEQQKFVELLNRLVRMNNHLGRTQLHLQ